MKHVLFFALSAGMFLSGTAHATHYGCITSPESPKTAFLYENESLPLSYVEKMQRASGADMLNNVPNVIYPGQEIIQSGHGKRYIDQKNQESIVVTDKNDTSKKILNVPYVYPDSYRMVDRLVIQAPAGAIFDGQPAKTLIYSFCGDD